MYRYDTISTVPNAMHLVEFDDDKLTVDVVSSLKSITDKKYFMPRSQLSRAIYGSTPRESFTFPQGLDDGRDMFFRSRGLDMAERSQKVGEVVEKLQKASQKAKEYQAHKKELDDIAKENASK